MHGLTLPHLSSIAIPFPEMNFPDVCLGDWYTVVIFYLPKESDEFFFQNLFFLMPQVEQLSPKSTQYWLSKQTKHAVDAWISLMVECVPSLNRTLKMETGIRSFPVGATIWWTCQATVLRDIYGNQTLISGATGATATCFDELSGIHL